MKKFTLATLLALSFSATAQDTHRIIFEPREGMSAIEIAKIVPFGSKLKKLGQSNIYVTTLPNGITDAQGLEKVKKNQHLKFAEIDKKVFAEIVPNDPYYGSQYHLTIINAPVAWDSTLGAGVTVAILDSGVDGSHPDLTSNLVPGYNLVDNNTNTSDVCGHGTAVAGTAAAAINNALGVAGVAGQAKIMPIRIAFNDPTYGCSAYDSAIANGLTYAADHGAKVANISYGGVATSSSVTSAANYMRSKGGLVFVSAGNTGAIDNTTPTDSMIVVSATDSSDNMASFSTFGNFVTLSAPGVGIYTTSSGGVYQAWSGTSFSSPMTAGVGALVLSANPALTSDQVKSVLTSTAKDLGAAGYDIYYGYGRVDAGAAVALAKSYVAPVDTTPPVVSITSPVANATVSGIVNVDATVTDNVAVSSATLQVNGNNVATDSTSPYNFAFDSSGIANGTATISVVGVDSSGNTTIVSEVINISNTITPVITDTTPPVVAINNPVAGNVSGKVNVSVSATDNSPASQLTLQLFIDNSLKSTVSGGTMNYTWNTQSVKKGVHQLKASAKDAAGNVSTTSITVTK